MHFPHLTGLFQEARIDDCIVCHIDQAIAQKLGARRGKVLISHDTMRKQARKHPDLTLDHYRALPMALERGEYRWAPPKSAIVIFVDEHCFNTTFRACVKATRDGRLYVVSFNRMRDRHAAKERRREHAVIRAHL
jgi:hypothetical protein